MKLTQEGSKLDPFEELAPGVFGYAIQSKWLNRKPPLDSSWRDWFETVDEELAFEFRWLRCEHVGHLWSEERRGAPVAEFLLCMRCGKIGERL